jgi:hypothetical protein
MLYTIYNKINLIYKSSVNNNSNPYSLEYLNAFTIEQRKEEIEKLTIYCDDESGDGYDADKMTDNHKKLMSIICNEYSIVCSDEIMNLYNIWHTTYPFIGKPSTEFKMCKFVKKYSKQYS